MILADTSVAVAAALPSHVGHEPARATVARLAPRLAAHTAAETYSVLTRMPGAVRISAADARSYLAQRFPSPPVGLPPEAYDQLLDLAAVNDIRGGAIYDALTAATALGAGATLLTRDRRAARTYTLVGADFRFVG